MVFQLSKTTKSRHGQPKINLWNTLVVRTDNHVYPRNNFATKHADIRCTVTRGTRQSSAISETRVNLNHVCCHHGHVCLTVDHAMW